MIDSFRGSYGFLSNFYLIPIEYEDIIYPSVEHAFQAAKTVSVYQRAGILGQSTSASAKRMGKQVTLRPNWEDIKIRVMESLVKQKFRDGDLKEKLLATGNEELIEGNWWGDTFWGIYKGRGFNYLGKILMKIREEYQKGE